MSAECPILPVGGYIPCEDPVVVRMSPEPIYADPLAKVSYSSDPGFKDGAVKEHTINIASKSQLTPLKVAEAFEAIFLEGLDEEGRQAVEAAEDYQPLDVELALSGLRWLRKHTTSNDNPVLRPKILATKQSLTNEQRRLAEEPIAAKPAPQSTTEADTVRQARHAEYQRRQTNYYQQFQAVADSIEAAHPDIDVHSFMDLGQGIAIYEMPDGELAAREQSTYAHDPVAQRVKTYLADPEALANDYLLGAVIRKHELSDSQRQIVTAYTNRISQLVLNKLGQSRYQLEDFTAATLTKWLNVGGGVMAETPYEDLKQLWEDDDEMAVAYNGAANRGAKVLSNSLQAIAIHHPRQLLDSMYLLAQLGLKPHKPGQRDLVLSVINDCLRREPQAGFIIEVSKGVESKETRFKAGDLDKTLSLFNKTARLLDNAVQNKPSTLPETRKRVIKRLIRPTLLVGLNGNKAAIDRLSETLHDEFMDYVESPEGWDRTLWNRFKKTATEA
jgi:hypothetical protein